MKYIPEQARFVKIASEKMGYEYEDIDEGNGYLIKVKNKSKSIFLSSGAVCSYPINSATSVGLAADKSHTARILLSLGYPCIPGQHFFITNERIKLRNPGHEYLDALHYADNLGYPVFCKPNNGSKGNFAERISSKNQLEYYIERVRDQYEIIIIQKFVAGNEYRVFCFDDTALFSYKKNPYFIEGDGVSSIQEQIDSYNRTLKGTGISSVNEKILVNDLHKAGLNLSSILALDERLNIQFRSNISIGGFIDHFTTSVKRELSDLALGCANSMKLRICGIDIIDVSKKGDCSDLIVLEVNGNPSMSSLFKMNHTHIAIEVWMKILRELM